MTHHTTTPARRPSRRDVPPDPARAARRRLRVGVAAAIVAFVTATASPAAAVDNSVLSATPGPNSTIDASPAALTLQFASPLGPTNMVTMTCGAEGQPAASVPLGKPVVLADQLTLSVPVTVIVPKGVCNVVWRVTDLNLQPAGSSSFSFVIANDTSTTSTTTTLPGSTVDTTVTTTTIARSTEETESTSGTNAVGPLGLFRWFSNISIAILFGSLVLIAVAWPAGAQFVETKKFLLVTWGLAVASSFLVNGALAAEIDGVSIGRTISPTGWGPLLEAGHGTAAIIRLVFVAASFYAVRNPDTVINPGYRLQALGLPAIAVVTLAFDRPEFGPIEWFAGGIHALAMAVWFGGLMLLARVVLVWPADEALVDAVRTYARYSVPAIAATVVSGIIEMLRLDSGSLGSRHGIVLILKTVIVAAMVFVAVAARQFIGLNVASRQMRRSTTARLRRALTIEAGLGIGVLAITSWLMALPPMGLLAADNPDLDLGIAHRFANEAMGVDLAVSFSEKVGPNDVRIEVIKPVENLSGLQIDFLPPATSSVNGITVDPTPLTGAGVAVLEKIDGLTLASSGTWTVVARIGLNEIGRETVFVGEELATPST